MMCFELSFTYPHFLSLEKRSIRTAKKLTSSHGVEGKADISGSRVDLYLLSSCWWIEKGRQKGKERGNKGRKEIMEEEREGWWK